MINNINLIGRLADQGQLINCPNGTLLYVNALAVEEPKQNNNNKDVFFIDIKAFGKLAEHIINTAIKGSKISISGTLSCDKWIDKNTGKNRSKFCIIVNKYECISKFINQRNQGNCNSNNNGGWNNNQGNYNNNNNGGYNNNQGNCNSNNNGGWNNNQGNCNSNNNGGWNNNQGNCNSNNNGGWNNNQGNCNSNNNGGWNNNQGNCNSNNNGGWNNNQGNCNSNNNGGWNNNQGNYNSNNNGGYNNNQGCNSNNGFNVNGFN